MKLMVWKQHEGPTDQEFKQGDIFAVKPDSWVPGNDETLKWLVVQTEDYGGNWNELVAPEYTVGATPDTNVMLRMRKYYLSFESLTPSQVDRWLDPTTRAPIVTGMWNVNDIQRR